MQAQGASDRPYAHGLLSTASGGRLADGAGMAQAGEEFIGAADIAGDLRAQLFGAAELFFLAKTLPKSYFQALWCRGQLSVQQVCFDAEQRAVERRPHTDIRNRAEAARLSVEARARDVDAPCGKEFLLRGEVQGREGEAAPRSCAADHFTCKSEGPTQKTRGVGDVAFGDFPANDGAGDDFSAIDHRGDNHNVESVLGAKFGEPFHVARLLMPEAKIFSDQNGSYVQIADENLLDKFSGRKPREIEREWEDHNRFEAKRVEPIHELRVG